MELASVRLFLNLFPGTGFPVAKKVAEHNRSIESVFGSLLPMLLPTGEAARPQAYERASRISTRLSIPMVGTDFASACSMR